MGPSYITSTIIQPLAISSPTTPSQPPRILLAAYTWNADLRRAGSELISRLNKPRHRHTRSEPAGTTPRLGQMVRITGRPQPTTELHILMLSKAQLADEDEVEARAIIVEHFRSLNVSVRVHVAQHASHRRSMLATTSSIKSGVHRAMQEDTQLGKVLLDGVSAAGLVLGEDQMEGDEGSQAFMEELANVLKSSTTSSRTTPSITVFLPRQIYGLGSFDFDLDDPLAARVARSAAEAFNSSMHKLQTPCAAPAPPTNCRHSTLGLPSLRPLLLRPAPGPGAQSISLRLDIGDAKDLVLRVTEAQTPATPSTSWFARPPAAPSPTSPTTTATPPSPTPNIPILSRARPLSALPRLAIPSTPAPRSPNLVSSFSPTSSEGSTSPQTPPSTSRPSASSAVFDHRLFTPICKLSAQVKRAEDDESPMSALDSPWANVQDLLKKRVESADQRQAKSGSEVRFEAPTESGSRLE